MKKILSLVLVSALGGAMTLGAYKLFLENEPKVVVAQNETPTFLPTNHISGLYNVEEEANFVAAAESTVNAVVHVKNVAASGGQMSIQGLFFGRTPSPQYRLGTGSGVIVDPTGYIITNNHVIRNSQELSVTLNNNKTYEAEIIGTDPKTDIALLKIDAGEKLPFVTFGDSDDAKIGEWVLAVGNPFNLTSTVTAGIISAKSRSLEGQMQQSYIQTDAAVNRGNSGGALVNTRGELIGINTAITSETGSYVGYSFAVPSNVAKKVVNDIIEFGSVQNGILGIFPTVLNSKNAEKLNITETEGVYIRNVEEDSGADKAGLKKGDIIKEIDGIKISKFSDLKGILNAKSLNETVQVTYLRNGEKEVTPVTLLKTQTFILPIVGIVKNAKSKDLKKLKADSGIKIVELNSNYANYWKNNGVNEGAIITAINGEEINSINDAENFIKNNSSNSLRIEIINNKGEKDHFYFR